MPELDTSVPQAELLSRRHEKYNFPNLGQDVQAFNI